jgi:UDP-N-acetylmuramoyl-tripeptide--D-alanyl-D-alanine ligase
LAVAREKSLAFARHLVRAYLSIWARFVLRLRHPRIVGITGSVGKTTTKEVVAAVLSHPSARSHLGLVRKSPGNLNDNLGLPLAVLGYPSWHHSTRQLLWWLCIAPFRGLMLAVVGPYPNVLVLEYAASDDGDVPRLARMARPEVAVVTAIGPAHLEVFGTMERIAEEKGALVRAVPPSGLVVLGTENPFLAELARQTRARVVTVDGTGLTLAHAVARVVGAYFGLPNEAIDEGIRDAPRPPRRLKLHTLGPITLIDDTINANPMSMRLALTTLRDHVGESSQRTVAVLGFMAELGANEAAYHREIGAFAHAHADVIVGVGTLAREYSPRHWFETAAECAAEIASIVGEGDVVLVKGSAAADMEAVTGALKRVAREWPDTTESTRTPPTV